MHITVTFDLQSNGVRSDFTMRQEIACKLHDVADSIYADEKDSGQIYDCMGVPVGSFIAMEVEVE